MLVSFLCEQELLLFVKYHYSEAFMREFKVCPGSSVINPIIDPLVEKCKTNILNRAISLNSLTPLFSYFLYFQSCYPIFLKMKKLNHINPMFRVLVPKLFRENTRNLKTTPHVPFWPLWGRTLASDLIVTEMLRSNPLSSLI